MSHDIELPRTAVAAILEARQSAAAAQESANICHMQVRQMEQTLSDNTSAYQQAYRKFQARLDEVESIARGNRITAIICAVCAVVFLITALIEWWA